MRSQQMRNSITATINSLTAAPFAGLNLVRRFAADLAGIGHDADLRPESFHRRM